jgi:hypothetical protein
MDKEEQDEVIRETFRFVREMLDRFSGFHPFVVAMTRDGRIVHVGGWNREEYPRGVDLYELLIQGIRERAAADEWKITCVCATVTTKSPTTGDLIDAARALIEEKSGRAVYVFLPYRKEASGSVDFGTVYACKGEFRVFASPSES